MTEATNANTVTPDHSLAAIIDRVIDGATGDTTTIGNLVDSVGRDSFTPLLLIPALAVATPLSGIPLFSSLMGAIIFLVSAQMLLQRDHIWLPRWLLRREVASPKVRTAFDKIRPALTWIDARSRKRLRLFTLPPLGIIPPFLCLVSGLIMPILEFVPFSSSVMGIGVALLALGMLTRDGAILLIAMAPYFGVAWLVARVFQI